MSYGMSLGAAEGFQRPVGTASFKAKYPVVQELFAKSHKGLLPPPPAGRGLRWDSFVYIILKNSTSTFTSLKRNNCMLTHARSERRFHALPPPSGFSWTAQKRGSPTPPFFAQLFGQLFRNFPEKFRSRSPQVRSPGQIK